MKITKCDKCPEAPKFDPATAKKGTLMLNCVGNLCVRTEARAASDNAVLYLEPHCAGTSGSITGGEPFTRADGKYLIEND